MAAPHARAARLEREAAAALGTTRVTRRPRYTPAPDMFCKRLANGETVQGECKSRKHAPKLVTDALEQARRYTPDALPIAIVRPVGGRAVACMYLDDFARAIGTQLAAPPAQPPLLLVASAQKRARR
jgi:hypothetical protein